MHKSIQNPCHIAKVFSSIPTTPKVLTVAIIQALAIQMAQAASIEVTSNLDDGTDCTLREAVQSVNMGSDQGGCISTGTFGNNDTIAFAANVSGSTIILSGSYISIDTSVSINPGGSDTTISGNNGTWIFGSRFSGITINLDHLILTAGSNVAGFGGAIDVFDGGDSSTLVLTNSTVTGSSSTGDGAGIFARDWEVNISDSTVSGNTAGINGNGGGLYANSSNINLSNSTVSGNSAKNGGGGISAHNSSTVTLTNCMVSDNTTYSGGGLLATSSIVTVINSKISGNSVSQGGGGLAAYSNAVVTLSKSTVSDNSANSNSSGLLASYSIINLTNTTVSGNTAGGSGGGLGIFASSANLSNSTISNNTASGGLGLGLFRSGLFPESTLTLENSVIANGTGSGMDCEFTGMNPSGHVVTMGSDNIVETNGCGGTPQSFDPGLTPLAHNGGPTQTHALMPGSPAIDAGDGATCETTDQRGEVRDDGICDIGAYEFKASPLLIAKKDRKMGSLMSSGEQWYAFNSMESQKLSMQTNGFIQANGFSGDTVLDFYSGNNPKTANLLKSDDDSGPLLYSNIKQNASSGPHLIRVKGKTAVDPYWLRLMSNKDILSFGDTASHFANKEIRVMSSAGITGGCGTNKYCPTDPVTRAQMAIFMLKAILGGNHSSPPASGGVFSDVSTSSFGASFIEEFSTLGITSGCGGGKYCPDLAVTREQMAVFLLRAWYGSSYTPPAATPAEINQFSDIANSFAKDWIVQLTKENITGGCGGGKFCPTDTVTRGQMAAFITRTFDLDVGL